MGFEIGIDIGGMYSAFALVLAAVFVATMSLVALAAMRAAREPKHTRKRSSGRGWS